MFRRSIYETRWTKHTNSTIVWYEKCPPNTPFLVPVKWNPTRSTYMLRLHIRIFICLRLRLRLRLLLQACNLHLHRDHHEHAAVLWACPLSHHVSDASTIISIGIYALVIFSDLIWLTMSYLMILTTYDLIWLVGSNLIQLMVLTRFYSRFLNQFHPVFIQFYLTHI